MMVKTDRTPRLKHRLIRFQKARVSSKLQLYMFFFCGYGIEWMML